MLKTLDILIGVATVMLLFSMAVTIVTQFVANLMQSRGKNLLEGLAGLLRQIDPSIGREVAEKIAKTLLQHPLVYKQVIPFTAKDAAMKVAKLFSL